MPLTATLPISTPVAAILARLPDAKPRGPGRWMARCPAHDDSDPSLSIGTGKDGQALLHCHAGCSLDAILGALGLEKSDLWPTESKRSNNARSGSSRTHSNGSRHTVAPPKAAESKRATSTPKAATSKRGRVVATYDYTDANGVLLYQVVRSDPKAFRQQRPDGDGRTIHGLAAGEYYLSSKNEWLRVKADRTPPAGTERQTFPETERVLYGLSELVKAPEGTLAFFCEGEKDADTLRGIDLLSTTTSGGAGKSHLTLDVSSLYRLAPVIIPDADAPGQTHAEEIAKRLHVHTSTRLLDLRAADSRFTGKDVTDYVGHLRKNDLDDSAIAQMLCALAQAAPQFQVKPCELAEDEQHGVYDGAEPYDPFPVEALPEPLRNYTREGAAALGCDASYIALPLLAASASAIGNSLAIQLKRSWIEPAIVWACIVGKSGTLKSPALELALAPLRKQQDEAMRQYGDARDSTEREILRYEAELTDWKKDKERSDDPPEKPAEPLARRFIVNELTVEALLSILADNPRGVLMFRDELAGWLAGFDRYAKGGRGGDAQRYIEMFHGRSVTSDRKTGRPTLHVPRAAVSIVGGIQPGILKQALRPEFYQNGLAARLLTVYPPPRPKRWTDAEMDVATTAAIQRLFDGLLALKGDTDIGGSLKPKLWPMTPRAKRHFEVFYNEHAIETAGLDDDLAAAFAKLECYCARFALVIQAVRAVSGDAEIGSVDHVSMKAAIELTRWFARETRRVYGIHDEDIVQRQKRELIELIESRGGRITARELARGPQRYRGRGVAEAALQNLCDCGLGRWEFPQSDATGGRPPNRFALLPRTGERQAGPFELQGTPLPDATGTR